MPSSCANFMIHITLFVHLFKKKGDLLYPSRLKYTPFFSRRPQPLDLHPMARLCCFSSSCKENGSANEPENQPRQLPGPPSLNGHMIRYPQWRFAAHLAQNETIGPINIHTSIH